MKRTLSATAAAAILTLVWVAESRAAKFPVAGEIVGANVLDPGKLTSPPLTHAGIVIVQGQILEEFLTGDLEGTMLVTATLIVNLNSGEGILFGTIDWEDPESDGGFSGPFQGQVSGVFLPGDGGFDGQWMLSGYGSHQGQTALIDNSGPFTAPPNQVYHGVIIVADGP